MGNFKSCRKAALFLKIGKIPIVYEVYILGNNKLIGDILQGRDMIKRLGKITSDFGEEKNSLIIKNFLLLTHIINLIVLIYLKKSSQNKIT